MPLRVIVVGAGIAGLCAAVALRQHGHSVTIFEKSKFATEVGAAIALSPNGVLVLQGLGFSFQNARAQSQDVWESLDGRTLERLAYTEVTDAQERFGAPFLAIHRVDLHTELLRLALDDDQERGSCSPPAALHLNCRIVAVQPEQGTVQLEDGSLHHADLVVAADGLRSVIRPAVVSREKEGEAMPIPSGMSAFRFLVPTASLKHDAVYERAKKWKYARGVTVMADTQDPDFKDRHIVWYACQEDQVQNFVGIQPTRDLQDDDQDEGDIKSQMLQEFGHFHPDIKKLLSFAENVKLWPLFVHRPLKSWTYGRFILIGDAAHPMLPFGGQGSNQAMEDGGALGTLLAGVHHATDVPERLTIFEDIRRLRASRVQILSRVRIGTEDRVRQELEAYCKPGDIVPTTFAARQAHDSGFNVLAACRDALYQRGLSNLDV